MIRRGEDVLKKLLRIFFACLLIWVGIAGCSHTQNQPTMQVGILKERPACYYSQGKLTGFNVQAAQAIGKQTHTKVKIKVFTSRAKLEAALAHHQIKLAVGSELNFTKEKLAGNLLYPKNVVFSTHSFSKLRQLKHRKIGTLKMNGTPKFLQENAIHIQQYTSINQLVDALDSGQIQAVMVNEYQYHQYLKEHPLRQKAAKVNRSSLKLPIFHRLDDVQVLSQQDQVYAADAQMAKQVKHIIHDLRMNGTLTHWSAKYYGYNYGFR